MRLLERLAESAQKPVSRRKNTPGSRVEESVRKYLEQCLNYRFQPGAVDHTERYLNWYTALSRMGEQKQWPAVVAFLQYMEPRILHVDTRKFKSDERNQVKKYISAMTENMHQTKHLFVLNYELDSSKKQQQAVVMLGNGRILIIPLV